MSDLGHREFPGFGIKDDHVVTFFHQFKYSSEDVQLVPVNAARVTTSSVWHFTFCLCNLSPGFGRAVVVPHVAQLVVIVVLASEDKEVAFVVATGMASPGTGLTARTLRNWALLAFNTHVLFGFEC